MRTFCYFVILDCSQPGLSARPQFRVADEISPYVLQEGLSKNFQKFFEKGAFSLVSDLSS